MSDQPGVKCPACGHNMKHQPFIVGEQLECWECESCGEIMDISDAEILREIPEND